MAGSAIISTRNICLQLLAVTMVRRGLVSRTSFHSSHRWVLHGAYLQEDFLKNNTTISNLKIRASVGVTGNQEIGNYRSLAQYSTSQTVLGGAAAITLRPSYLGNPDLKWERTTQIDGGT
jgi:hypothetical protein